MQDYRAYPFLFPLFSAKLINKWPLATSTGQCIKSCPLFKSCGRNTAFTLCPCKRTMKSRVSGDITKTGQLAKWSKDTEENMSSILNRISVKRPMAEMFM
uniref:Uncharacterized protein n=1 Tax=Apteryx owenii TaxID=8824 RepID=A0A8B9P821_APTOW